LPFVGCVGRHRAFASTPSPPPASSLHVCQMRVLFRHVVIDKPTSSRANSKEAFLVCRHYDPPAGYVPCMDTVSYGMFAATPAYEPAGAMAGIVPFVAIGDLAGHARAVADGSEAEVHDVMPTDAAAATVAAAKPPADATVIPTLPPAVAAKLAQFAV